MAFFGLCGVKKRGNTTSRVPLTSRDPLHFPKHRSYFQSAFDSRRPLRKSGRLCSRRWLDVAVGATTPTAGQRPFGWGGELEEGKKNPTDANISAQMLRVFFFKTGVVTARQKLSGENGESIHLNDWAFSRMIAAFSGPIY